MMRRIAGLLVVVGLAVTLGALTTSAQTAVNLNGNSTNTVTITAVAPPCSGCQNLQISFAVPYSAGNTAAGQGALTGQSGYYTLSGGPVSLTYNGPNFYLAGPTTLSFEVCSNHSAACATGTDLLSGTLTLVNLQQAGSKGFTNINIADDMNITGGSWAGYFPHDQGIASFTISLSGLTLDNLTGTHLTHLISGNSFDPVPEPGSILLFGSGLLALGGVLRRKGTTGTA